MAAIDAAFRPSTEVDGRMIRASRAADLMVELCVECSGRVQRSFHWSFPAVGCGGVYFLVAVRSDSAVVCSGISLVVSNGGVWRGPFGLIQRCV
jgi:hypothetical protein